jgi:outer membrane protein OmpA-like peptidoglycan-associated protein
MKLAAIATTAIALVISGQAWADENLVHDVYWSVGGGLHDPSGSLAYTTSDAKNGWFGRFAIGGHLTPHWRTELELSHRTSETDFRPAVPNDIDGDYGVTALHLNFLWDFNAGGGFTPYLGAGAGPDFITASGNHTGGVWHIDDDTWGLGGAAIAGLAFAGKHWGLDLEYRYVGETLAKINTPLGKVKENFTANVFSASLRFPIGVAPPPPPPPPPVPPCVPDSTLGPFKVYFPWAKYNLTKEAAATIQEIANQVKSKKIKKVHLEGDADTSGGDAANQLLSERRAGAVRDALIADGVPSGVIDMVGMGEKNPAVKSGDNVKEPLNRRAEITIKIADGNCKY